MNSLGGELLAETWALVARFGRFVEIDNKDALANTYLPMKPFDRSVTFSSINLRELAKHRPDELRDVLAELVGLLERRVVVPIRPVTVLPISQFATALRRIWGGDGAGKIVLTLGKDERVHAESALRPFEYKMSPEATYIITGGTRGTGLNLAYWMAENGAKNVVVLGRSGASGPEVQKLLAKSAARMSL